MATASTMLPLGTELPSFALPDVSTGESINSDDFAGRPLLVVFLCVHCPYVKRIQDGLAAFSRDYAGTPLAMVGIASNDPETYPDDAPTNMARVAAEVGYAFPIGFDETQDVARAFTAACTPDFFLFDANHRLAYRGQFDGARPSNDLPVTGEDLRAAAEAVLGGEQPSPDQVPSLGCSIKWRSEGITLRR
jgi:peroxiredoxin